MKIDFELGFFAPTRSWRSICGLLRRRRCVRCPRLPPSPLFHASVRVHCTLHSGKRIRLLLSTRHLTLNYAQEGRSKTSTGRQDRRPQRRGNETALRSRIKCYANSIANGMRCWLGDAAALALASVVASPIPPAALQLQRPLEPAPPPPPYPLATPSPLAAATRATTPHILTPRGKPLILIVAHATWGKPRRLIVASAT